MEHFHIQVGDQPIDLDNCSYCSVIGLYFKDIIG